MGRSTGSSLRYLRTSQDLRRHEARVSILEERRNVRCVVSVDQRVQHFDQGRFFFRAQHEISSFQILKFESKKHRAGVLMPCTVLRDPMEAGRIRCRENSFPPLSTKQKKIHSLIPRCGPVRCVGAYFTCAGTWERQLSCTVVFSYYLVRIRTAIDKTNK